MRNRIVLAVLMFALCIFMPRTAAAWNCPTGQIRQQAPAGTSPSTPFYDVVEGIAFICVPTPTTNGNPQTQTQNQTTTSIANSANLNTNAATGGQGGTASATATGGNQSQSTTASSTGGNNSNNTTTNVAAPIIPVTTAYAPTSLPSAPCIKGFGVGVQSPSAGISIGGGKVDTGCDERELARSYALLGSKIAACKILIANERSQKAGVTLEDCMGPAEQAAVESLGDYARRMAKGQQ